MLSKNSIRTKELMNFFEGCMEITVKDGMLKEYHISVMGFKKRMVILHQLFYEIERREED